jgi:DNA-binding transcriptional ArsR family regulator
MSDHEFHKPAHKGYWIPVELDRFGLTNIEKLFLSIIDSLDDPEKHCYASNGYFAEQMGLSISRISFYLTKFKKMGLIEEVSFSGRQRIIRVCKENWYVKELKNSKKESYVKTRRQTTRFQEGRLRENAYHIVKSIEKSKERQPQTPSSQSEIVVAVVDFYRCLSNIDIEDSDKRALMKFPESTVALAIEWATHPKTNIKTTLIQGLMWYCKQETPPSIPSESPEKNCCKIEEFEKNRELAKEIQKEFENITKGDPLRYVSAGENIITFRDKRKDIYLQIPYVEKDFLHKLNNTKNQFKTIV